MAKELPKSTCKCGGMPRPGVMCRFIIVRGKLCSYDGNLFCEFRHAMTPKYPENPADTNTKSESEG